MLSALLLLVLASAASPPAASGWVRVRSPHFEVLSDGTAAEARAVAASLERFRGLVGRAASAAFDPPVPTTVFAFRDENSFEPFLPVFHGERQRVGGFYQAAPDRVFIALTLAAGSERERIALHEYAHLFLGQVLPPSPPWLAEGLAELFAAARTEGPELVLGDAVPEHVRLLQRKPLPLSAVLEAHYESSVYNEGDRRSVFYAESWAVVHYLLLGRGGSVQARLGELVQASLAGADPGQAFRDAVGEDPESIERALAAYLARPALPTWRVPAPTEQAEPALATDAPSVAEVVCRQGELLLARGRLREAASRLRRALAADPSFVPAQLALVSLYAQQLDFARAREHVEAARRLAPGDPLALFAYVDVLVKEALHRGEPLPEAEEASAAAALREALRLAPWFAEACEALVRLREDDPRALPELVALCERARALNPTRAELGLVLARLYVRRQDLARAAALLDLTARTTRDEALRIVAELSRRRVAAVVAQTAEVRGTLTGLRCLAGGALDFVVEAEGRSLRLHTDSARDVFLFRAGGEPLEQTFTCGAQSAPVLARYEPLREHDQADGRLLSLIFR